MWVGTACPSLRSSPGRRDPSSTVEYQQLGQKVPCRVVYHKPPRAPNGLWKAQAQVGFCESRAEELVQTLERSGWSCEEIQDVAAIGAGQVRTREAGALPDEEPELQPLAGLRTQAERAETVTSGETARSERAIPTLEPTEAGTAGKTVPSEAISRSGAAAANLQRGRGEQSGDVALQTRSPATFETGGVHRRLGSSRQRRLRRSERRWAA
jgi:hypothetical protein